MGKRIALWIVTVLAIDAFVFGLLFKAPDWFMCLAMLLMVAAVLTVLEELFRDD